MSARRRAEDLRLEKYKELSEVPSKPDPRLPEKQRLAATENLIRRMEKRFNVPKVNERQSYLKAKTEIRPLYTRLTPSGAISMRSPLVSMIFPSLKTKTEMFQEETTKKEAISRVNGIKPSASLGNAGAQATGMFVQRQELEKIVEQETKRAQY